MDYKEKLLNIRQLNIKPVLCCNSKDCPSSACWHEWCGQETNTDELESKTLSTSVQRLSGEQSCRSGRTQPSTQGLSCHVPTSTNQH